MITRSGLALATALLLIAGCETSSLPTSSMEAGLADDSAHLSKKNGPKTDADGNGIPDAGIYVTGHYTSMYAYDASGGWYEDLGDGRVRGSVGSVDELDAATSTTCNYVNNYRADFGNDPFMDAGWIQNHIKCRGFDDNNTYNYLIVHESDPRYTGNPEWAIWGTWEFKALTISGFGNLVRPESHIGG